MRRRIVVVAPFAPAREGHHGGSRALHGLLGDLCRRHDVALVHLERDVIDPAVASRLALLRTVPAGSAGAWERRARDARGLLVGRSSKAGASAVPALRREVRELAGSFGPGVVQVEHGYLGDTLGAAGDALRVVTIHDPAATWGEPAGLPLPQRLAARAALREERRVLSRADAAVVLTERDRRLIAPAAPGGCEVTTIPLGAALPETALDPAGATPPVLLFVGGFGHPPNVAAARALAEEILPRVRSVRPDVRVELVGSGPTPEVQALGGPAVDVLGDVAAVTPHLDRAAIVVVPIELGGGMRVKVLEALAAGKAVVASPRAAEGISARPGRELVVADGAGNTAAAVLRLLADETERVALARRARAWALRELSWEVVADRYDALYERAAAHRKRGR